MPAMTEADRFVPGVSVDQFFAGLTSAIGVRKGFRVERPSQDTLVAVHRYLPGWAFILAVVGVFVFLLGLLFLLVKTEERLTFVGRDVDGGCRVTVTGQSDHAFLQFVQEYFLELARNPEPVAV